VAVHGQLADEATATKPKRVVVITSDVLGLRMAGPGIRAWEIAKTLARTADVRLVSTTATSLETDLFPVFRATRDDLKKLEKWADVIIFQGHLLAVEPWLVKSEKLLVADIYDPMHLEQLEQAKELSEDDRNSAIAGTVQVLNDQIARADFMMCASEKQRDFWLGVLGALGRINPATYNDDESLRSLLAVVPFGVDDDSPVQKKHGIKGVIEGISSSDKVIIWGGGIYNWFDPITLVRAVEVLSRSHSDVRLFFLGVKHPNPDVPSMTMAFQAKETARKLGLLDKFVFFNEGWVPYDSRADYLLDADVGVSTHLDHLETEFSFRTRILDYLWASLPIVTTAGDTFAQLVHENELGIVVPAQDVDLLASALGTLLFDDERRKQTSLVVREFATSMTWKNVLTPLVEYCDRPHPAADRVTSFVLPSVQNAKDMHTRIVGLEQSASWRMTRPIRWASTKVRAIRHRRG
jgi:glycosyltransferase involved in cell wall biosynthesis